MSLDHLEFFNIKPQTQINQYQVISQIGSGGMGVVYLVKDALNRKLAMKLIKLERGTAKRRFRREMEISAELQHDNIVKVLDAGAMNKCLYIVMEYIHGKPLDEYWQSLELHEKMVLFHKIAKAVGYAHSKKIVHRDLKPDNILVTPEGEPKIMDFGLAKWANGEVNDLTKDGSLLGTPRYMSPEQLSGKNSLIDMRTDVYALGVILYEMVTNQKMIQGKRRISIFSNIATYNFKPIQEQTEVPKEIENIWRNSVAHRHQRYADAQKMSEDIAHYLTQKKRPFTKRVQRFLRYHSHIIIVAMSVSITLVALYPSFFRDNDKKIIYVNDFVLEAENLINLGFFTEAESALKKAEKYRHSRQKIQLLRLQILFSRGEYTAIIQQNTQAAQHQIEATLLQIKALVRLNASYPVIAQYLQLIYKNDELSALEKQDENTKRLQNLRKIKDEATYHAILFAYHKKMYQKVFELKRYLTPQFRERSYANDLKFYIGESYLQQYKKSQSKTDLQKAYEIFTSIYDLFPEKAQVAYKIGVCLFKLKQPKNAQKYLEVCCQLQPQNSAYRLLLGKAYAATKNYDLANINLKMVRGKEKVKAIEGLFKLVLEDARYQDDVFWFLLRMVALYDEQNLPDLLESDVIELSQKYKVHYREYNNSKKIDGKLFQRYLSVSETRQQAVKAFLLAGYKQDFSHLLHKESLEKKILLRIQKNMRNFIIYLIAHTYLYNTPDIQNLLHKHHRSVEQILHNEKETILIRYLAAKALARIQLYQTVAAAMKSKNSETAVVCSAALSEVNFVFDLRYIGKLNFKLDSRYKAIIYARIFPERHMRYFDLIPRDTTPVSKEHPIYGIVENLRQNLAHEDKVIKVICAALLWRWTGDSELNTILHTVLHEKGPLATFANYYYWKSSYPIDYEDKYFDLLLQILQNSTAKIKHIALNNQNLNQVLLDNPKTKQKFIKALQKLAQEEDLYVKTKASSLIVSTDPKKQQNLYLGKIPLTVKIIVYMLGNLFKVFEIHEISRRGMVTKTSIHDLRNMGFTIMTNRNEPDEFKNFICKTGALFGVSRFKNLKIASSNLGANFLMSATTSYLYSQKTKPFFDLVLGNKSVSKSSLKKLLVPYLQHENPHVRMSAWAAQTYLSNRHQLQKLYQQGQKTEDVYIREGISWGINRFVLNDVMKNVSIQKKSQARAVPYYDIYIDFLRKAKNSHYIPLLRCAAELTNEDIRKAQFHYELAVIHKSLEEPQAIHHINKAIDLIKDLKSSMLDTWVRYQFEKATILSSNIPLHRQEVQSIIEKHLFYINNPDSLTTIATTLAKFQEEKYKDLLKKVLRKQLELLCNKKFKSSDELFQKKYQILQRLITLSENSNPLYNSFFEIIAAKIKK
ncbi:serine/threonine protein kinase [Candidatus Uabimicrobium amorphum]|uniref:non-specific serine/threonine protein kinase n=1 Tax=Uabimicrobium amorphum TaxID=2596890 RepID=A0A5S9ILZ7_UABAM|nr:serine/threonine-protein kinase [Candidatus Uabimicrobium amorphum]BBM83801.1 protein kinase [Candidatus Uabimicrobium amorphum]